MKGPAIGMFVPKCITVIDQLGNSVLSYEVHTRKITALNKGFLLVFFFRCGRFLGTFLNVFFGRKGKPKFKNGKDILEQDFKHIGAYLREIEKEPDSRNVRSFLVTFETPDGERVMEKEYRLRSRAHEISVKEQVS